MTSSRACDVHELLEALVLFPHEGNPRRCRAERGGTSHIDARVNATSHLSEIEALIDSLSLAQKQELLLFLTARLRRERRSVPGPRDIPREQIGAWIAEDERDLERLRG